MATGMEPLTLYYTWRPSPQDDPTRPGIEGFFLLRDMPHYDGYLPPVEFPDDCVETMQKTMAEIDKLYDAANNSQIRDVWNKWQRIYFPRSPHSLEYVQQLRSQGLPYHIPLRATLLNKFVVLVDPAWGNKPLEVAPISTCIFD